MAALILPKRFSRQPQQGARIDIAHPLNKDFSAAYLGSTRQYFGCVAVAGGYRTAAGSLRRYHPKYGIALKHGNAFGAQLIQQPVINYPTSTGDLTILSVVRPSNDTAVRQLSSFGQTSTAVSAAIETGDGSATVLRGRIYLGGNRYFGGSFTVGPSDVVVAIMRHRYNTEQAIFLDGVKDPATTAFTGSGFNQTYFGAVSVSGDQEIFLNYAWARALSDDEIAEVSEDPYQLFKQGAPRRIWVPVSIGGTPATANPAGVSATSAVGSPTAAGAANVSVSGVGATASVGTATASGETIVPGWATPAGVSATATVGTATAAGNALIAVAGVAATASVGVASATGAEVVHGTASPAGVSAVASVGAVSLMATANALPAGVSVLASIGNPIASGEIHIDATALPAGVIAYTYIGQVIASDGFVPVYARAPSGSGYSPKREESQSRPANRNQSRPANNQRNYR